MFVKLNPNTLNIEVRVGVLEKYSPNKDLKALNKRVEKLREKVQKFRSQTIEPELAEINNLVEQINEPFMPKKQDEGVSE